MVLFGTKGNTITIGMILLISFSALSCGKKNKSAPKKENPKVNAAKKNDLELEPELKERKFFQEDALGQPKKYSEPEEDGEKTERDEAKKKETKSPSTYLGSTQGCKSGDCKNGNGIYVYASGEVYSGTFKNDKRHGSGNILYKDGDRFAGNFQNDKKAGIGTYRFASGAVFSGRFYEDGESAEGFLTVGKKKKECSIIRNQMNCRK
ncbi:hypothetical protein JWG44_20145 [Leptospira sp. 201903071]|uniref:hypothetical protein n=1 Tax=Leptospira ainazelensis TaxID=2810034 RepID=UPI001963C731|nr:hypothetical protein [Leptospira ainazelensis]MBM9502569.1 hypothetical protein [Leptospira ainazelensis]